MGAPLRAAAKSFSQTEELRHSDAAWIHLAFLGLVLGLLSLASSEPQAHEAATSRAERSASVKAAIACAEKVQTTADTRKCWIIQIDRAQKDLDREYRQFLGAIPLDKQKDFASAQEAWQRYSTSQCNLFLSVFEGTMWHPVSDQCLLRKVEERTREVAEMRREYERR